MLAIARVLLVVGFASSAIQANKQIPRPHGVSFLKASLYQPGVDGTWTCLDGVKTIKYTQVNDDYCDCADSSDEPGTSACPNGIFHCSNRGHRAQNIISTRVNDGICDCCDGSDEYQSGETNICANTCEELGRIAQQEQREKADLHKRGAARRSEMISEGKKLKVEREIRRSELEQQKKAQDAVKAEKEELKRQAEGTEAEALDIWREQQREREAAAKLEEEPLLNSEEAHLTFARYDKNKDGFVEITELQVDISLDRDRNGVVTVEEAKFFLDERERMNLDSFLALAWPRLKTQQLVAQGIFEPPADANTQVHLEGTEEHDQEQQQYEEQREELSHEGEEEAAEEEEEGFEEEEDADVGVGSAAETTPTPEYDPETQRLVEQANAARAALQEAENALRELEQEIKEINDMNAKDYGPNEEYAALDGQCYTYEDREYIYTLCPFDRAAQKQRNGHSETTLGRWDSWSNAQGAARYAQQKYAQGASCWNGPQRTTTVQLHCGMEERITGVSEPNRCEYFFDFETPAACNDAVENADAHLHDEL